tara:strand:- start:1092 stop:1205 length:114 start_codon:yes stop_codon:yes gene_type:complete
LKSLDITGAKIIIDQYIRSIKIEIVFIEVDIEIKDEF